MWETIFILGRETGNKASDHFNDLYITVMLAVIPFVLILLGVVEIIRLLDIKGKKNYQFGMRSIAMFVFMIVGIIAVPFTVGFFNDAYEIITGTSDIIDEEDKFYERIENEDYDYVVEGYGEVTFKEHFTKLFHVQIDGKEYVIKQDDDHGMYEVPEDGQMRLFLIRDAFDDDEDLPEDYEDYYDDTVVRLDVWKE